MSRITQGAAQSARQNVTEASRKRAAVETFARHEAALRRTARRYSLCDDDADDALQRALEILLVKAPSDDHRELVRWTQTVVKHEALAVRRDRERILGGPASLPAAGQEDWVALIPTEADGPAERVERREAVARSREALRALKPQELRALSLLAEGYSYAEIGEITGFSRTKINRSLAEGRQRFRNLLARSEEGERCAELAPLLSAFCDGEAGPEDSATVREHLRACAGCRGTMRAYRAAPRAAAALAPVLPAWRAALERAHEALNGLASRLGAGDPTMPQLAAAGGARGTGMAALAKALAICVGAAGGAAACVATGVVPTPLLAAPPGGGQGPAAERQQETLPDTAPPSGETGVAYEPEPNPAAEPPEGGNKRPAQAAESSPPPDATSGAVEYVPPETAPAPTSAAAPASTSSSESAGSAAGEFGP